MQPTDRHNILPRSAVDKLGRALQRAAVGLCVSWQSLYGDVEAEPAGLLDAEKELHID